MTPLLSLRNIHYGLEEKNKTEKQSLDRVTGLLPDGN